MRLFVLAFVGCVMGGIVPVPISPQLSFKNIEVTIFFSSLIDWPHEIY